MWFLCWKNYRLALSSQHLFVSCDFLSPNSVKLYSAVSTLMHLPLFARREDGIGKKIHATLQEHVGTRAPLVLRFILTVLPCVLHPREGPGNHKAHTQSVRQQLHRQHMIHTNDEAHVPTQVRCQPRGQDQCAGAASVHKPAQ